MNKLSGYFKKIVSKIVYDTKRFLVFLRNTTENFGDSLIPKNHRKGILGYFRRASITKVPYFGFGMLMYCIILLSLFTTYYILKNSFFSNADIIVKIVLSVILFLLTYVLLVVLVAFMIRLYLDVKIQLKIRDMEENFPEFLSNLTLNLRICGTLHIALENSAESDLGVLSDEVKIIVKNIRLGNSEEQALTEFMEKYDSPLMSDSLELLLTSWKKGGNTTILVERLYENMKSSKYLRDKIIASVTNYKIFLTTLALVLGPAMFALTFHLINLIRKITGVVSNIPDNSVLPFAINSIRINDSDFILFASLSVVVIATSIAFINSIVRTGKMTYAYKQMFLYAIISLISFQIFMVIFKLFFAVFAV